MFYISRAFLGIVISKYFIHQGDDHAFVSAQVENKTDAHEFWSTLNTNCTPANWFWSDCGSFSVVGCHTKNKEKKIPLITQLYISAVCLPRWLMLMNDLDAWRLQTNSWNPLLFPRGCSARYPTRDIGVMNLTLFKSWVHFIWYDTVISNRKIPIGLRVIEYHRHSATVQRISNKLPLLHVVKMTNCRYTIVKKWDAT